MQSIMRPTSTALEIRRKSGPQSNLSPFARHIYALPTELRLRIAHWIAADLIIDISLSRVPGADDILRNNSSQDSSGYDVDLTWKLTLLPKTCGTLREILPVFLAQAKCKVGSEAVLHELVERYPPILPMISILYLQTTESRIEASHIAEVAGIIHGVCKLLRRLEVTLHLKLGRASVFENVSRTNWAEDAAEYFKFPSRSLIKCLGLGDARP